MLNVRKVAGKVLKPSKKKSARLLRFFEGKKWTNRLSVWRIASRLFSFDVILATLPYTPQHEVERTPFTNQNMYLD